MIDTPTVLVVGAGASKPYGFPLGTELRDRVLEAATAPLSAFQVLRTGTKPDELLRFAEVLARSGFSSVDAFLEEQPAWISAGKAVMALCLLQAEFKARPHILPPHQPADHWYQSLWACLKAPSWAAFRQQPFHIVTFNYDRSLEHYLAQVLSTSYSVSLPEVVAALPISHVHGMLGSYEDSRFGARIDEEMLKAASSGISVVHEREAAHSAFSQARRRLKASRRVLFLGFGYLPANMRKLGFADGRSPSPRQLVVGTHRGIKAKQWHSTCDRYGFSPEAKRSGSGSVSEFLANWLS